MVAAGTWIQSQAMRKVLTVHCPLTADKVNYIMRHRNVLSILARSASVTVSITRQLAAITLLALVCSCSMPAGAQILTFSPTDWLLHRGSALREGANGDTGILPSQPLGRTWVYPGTADMPAEIVVDNTILPVPAPAFPPPAVNYPAPTQDFQVSPLPASWTYPALSNRTGGAWPPTDPNFDKLGDYIYTNAVQSPVLAGIGVSTLGRLPDLGNAADQTTGALQYRLIHNDLALDKKFARWTFGTKYPYGTYQGTRQVSFFKTPTVPAPVAETDYHQESLAPNQRYSVYIRFPSSGTLDNSPQNVAHPNVDHVMVRVSYGANVDDPITSRIFMLNFGGTGGTWMRIRTGPGDDRYFPYDGTSPIRVTLYSKTPDDPNDTTLYGATAIVPADSVRLVPEALRGDIHASASSARWAPGPGSSLTLNTPPVNRTTQLTYFGRDETTGPIYITNKANAANYPTTGFPTIPWDPTLPPNPTVGPNYNPLIADPTSSVRSAVFYCIEDDLANQRYGKLRWRFPARANPVNSVTVDDEDGAAFFSVTNPAVFNTTPGAPVINPANQPYNTQYRTATVSATAAPVESASWQQGLPDITPGGTWSVYVWIPAGNPTEEFAHFATYQITTDQGTIISYTLDQRNVDPNNPNAARTGMWRQLAGGVRFAGGNVNGTAYAAVGNVKLLTTSQRDIDEGGGTRLVVADAVQFVSESRTSSSVVAAPLIANVKWPSGTERQVVYFATTDGHVWAMDAFGTAQPNQPFTATTAYWVYPSITNPAVPAFRGLQDDPNYNADPNNNRANLGVDGDLISSIVGGQQVFTPVRKAPELGGWVSSPELVRVRINNPPALPIYQQYIVLGNQNGRLYAFDAVGRTNAGNEPFANTFALGDAPGVPGTSSRMMTWPSTARDKWMRKTNLVSEFSKYTDDAAKGVIQASPSADVAINDPLFVATKLITGAGDGHVYAVDISFPSLTPNERISRSTVNNAASDGQPLWLYPSDKTQIDRITQPGALSPLLSNYAFTAGGRVYSINTIAAAGPNGAPGTPKARWIFPFTATPPGNPDPVNDKIREDTEFTAPALRNVQRGFNGDREAIFIANRDGRIFAFDNLTGSPPNAIANPPIWTSTSQGATRASATYIDQLQRQSPYNLQNMDGPRILLPLDTGAITAVDVLGGPSPTVGGAIIWSYFDALIGAVPLNTLDTAGNTMLSFFATSNAYRGADASTANQWVFEGDEGNQDTGEVNGQMRAYANAVTIGLTTPGEPNIQPATGGVELRLVDLWSARRDQVGPLLEVWDFFGLPPLSYMPFTPDPTAKSPFDERILGHQKANQTVNGTATQFAIYEWGDTIYMAAWGLYAGNALPQVTFTISGATNKQIPAIVTQDAAYGTAAAVPVPRASLTTFIPGTGDQPATPFVAKAQYSLSRGAEDFAQTPGRQYKISAFAQLNTNGTFFRSPVIYAGQFDPPVLNPMPPPNIVPPKDPNDVRLVQGIGPPRLVAIAHPFAMTTRGPAGSGPGVFNVVGWTDNIKTDNSTTDFTEIMSNGNSLSAFAAGAFVPTTMKDLVAPLGFATHGSSIAYTTIDNSGRTGPGLQIADRSNLWKNNQRLSNVRVERTEMRWGWERTTADAFKAATGNAMNPLPWETFPNTIPNVSPDYPDVVRERATFKQGEQNLSARGVTLLPPDTTTTPGTKFLRPTLIDLVVDVPKYQPANINAHYYDLNGIQSAILLAPMNSTNGIPGSGVPQQAASSSAGYVGSYAVYVDSNNDGIFQGFAPGVSQGQRVVLQAQEEVFRQVNVGLSVPPDVNLRTEEETVDIGNVAHSMGYSPSNLNRPFQPSFLGQYTTAITPNGQSLWDSPLGFQFFKPFTVRNQGNVNLVNVRAAKVQGDYSYQVFQNSGGLPIPDNQHAFWSSLLSDQVEPFYTFNNPSLAAVPYQPFPNGPGNLGVVTSLDHWAGPLGIWPNQGVKFDNNLWPSKFNGYPIPNLASGDYVLNGNVLGWTASSRRRPTVGKPRPGDTASRTMSIPDTYYGDPLNELAQLKQLDQRDVRPKISVAIPLGTPAGTYTMPVYVFEDHVPEQWRAWIYYTRGGINNPDPTPITQGAGDDDGVINTVLTGQNNPAMMPESRSNPFTLKVTVAESRLTNGSSSGAYVQIDNRKAGNVALPPTGANITPVAMRDVKTGSINLFWPSNRAWDGAKWLDPGTPDAPWYLYSTQLHMAGDPNVALNAQAYYDWQFEPISGLLKQWWNPVAQAQQYPTASLARNLFPSQSSDVLASAPPSTPLVPGTLNVSSVRHATPALIQDDDPVNNTNLGYWLFWQGAANKSGASGGSFAQDTRTFYVQLQNGIAPDPTVTAPYSFLNDPGLPKYAPKPLIITDVNLNKVSFLFWYGGAQGRTRLYFNSATNLNNVTTWSADTPLQTPGTLQFQSEPTPIHRRIYTTWFNPLGETLDCIDVVYTGVLSHRKQPETLLTRYALEYRRDASGVITNQTPTGRLVVIPIGVTEGKPNNPPGLVDTQQTAWNYGVVDEMLARQGASATFAARDLAFLFSANRWDTTTTPARFRRDLLDATGKPYMRLRMVDRGGVSTDLLLTNPAPVFDSATGRVYFASALGGQIAIDPQGGTITFTGVAPRNSDMLLLSYTPQTLRVNVSRNDSGVIVPPAGNDGQSGVPWINDAAFTPRTHIEPTGSNTGPVTFLDRTNNPRWRPGQEDNTVGSVPNGATSVPVTRLWSFFRKSDASTAASSTIYYKSMRLMVRLPRGVVRNQQPNWNVLGNITVTGNTGPYEVDWIRGRVYFTEADEGRLVSIAFNYARAANGNAFAVPATLYRVMWGDEISSSLTPGDATTNERVLPLSTPVNEGQISAFKDPFQDKVWIFWSSTRAGTTDLYYMAINPQFYTQPGF